MNVEIRQATADELPQIQALTAYAFANNATDEQRASNPLPLLAEWTLCAFVDGRMATSFGAFPFRVRLNSASVAMAGVTMVSTLPEYRRLGLLRRVMTQAFAEQRDRGEAFAILWASLGAIYQRYGYAMSTQHVSYRAELRRIAFNDGDPSPGRVRLLPVDEARPILMDMYRTYARPRNMMIQRAPMMWDVRLRDGGATGEPGGPRSQYGVYRNADGEPRAYVHFELARGDSPIPVPDQHLNVIDAVWLDLEAYRGLWDFFLAHDLADTLHWTTVDPDDPAPYLVAEPRALHRATRDGVWMRVTDAQAALQSRPYGESGALVMRVHDDLCEWNDATFTLETTGPDRDARRSDEQPDVEVPVASLSLLLSGQRSATQLARAGRLRAESEKALTLADRLFATRFAPFCPDGF